MVVSVGLCSGLPCNPRDREWRMHCALDKRPLCGRLMNAELKQVKVGDWITEWINKWIIEWLNQWVNHRLIESMSESLSDWIDDWITKWLLAQANCVSYQRLPKAGLGCNRTQRAVIRCRTVDGHSCVGRTEVPGSAHGSVCRTAITKLSFRTCQEHYCINHRQKAATHISQLQ